MNTFAQRRFLVPSSPSPGRTRLLAVMASLLNVDACATPCLHFRNTTTAVMATAAAEDEKKQPFEFVLNPGRGGTKTDYLQDGST